MDIQQESLEELTHGHKTVAASAVALTDSQKASKGVLIRAPGASDPVPNTAPIWIGRSNAVTADSTATGGMPLLPGASIFIPIDDPAKLWLISTAASQDVAWMVI